MLNLKCENKPRRKFPDVRYVDTMRSTHTHTVIKLSLVCMRPALNMAHIKTDLDSLLLRSICLHEVKLKVLLTDVHHTQPCITVNYTVLHAWMYARIF